MDQNLRNGPLDELTEIPGLVVADGSASPSAAQWDLGAFMDPHTYQHPLDISGQVRDDLWSYLRKILMIRLAEQRLAAARRDSLVGGPTHLGVGQEAVAVGVSKHLRNTDRVFGTHRSHAHVLALGSSLHGLFAEVLGKETGLSRGMGGSMHLWDQPRGFYGSVPIVAATVPLAVGAGLAAKMQGSSDIGVAYFGDGAVEEGVVHESLNLARMLRAPVLFVVENNLFASHMHISLRQPKTATARFAAAHDIPYEIADGNDVLKVAEAAARLIQRARAGDGPGYLEAVTYRWYGHVDWREDIDVGVQRSVEDLTNWRKRDPLKRLAVAMVMAGVCQDADIEQIEREVSAEVESAWLQAMADPYPEPSALLDRVYTAEVAAE